MSSEGGTAAALPEVYFRVQDISADGPQLLGLSWYEAQRRTVLAKYSLKDKTLALMPDFPLNALFLPDGGLAGVQRIQGKSVVGFWPDGGRGSFTPVAPPTADGIYAAAVSRKGRIALSRGQSTNDVVLITAK